ncbi:PucR family transcriptional regulator ligand-binding domain-containing protein [Paenarthrobacter histidinolovorans]
MRISDLVDDPDLKISLRVPGNPGRLARPITWCAPTEHMDPTPFLSVNALVLTNGMGLNVKDYRIWEAYVERLMEVPVSGLVFGLGAAHRELPAGLVEACEAHGLPLLELPPEVPFVLVMRHVEHVIATERYEELRSGWELADECTRLAADGRSLATVLERVAAFVQARVTVVDDVGFELIGAGDAAGGTARTTLRIPSGESQRFRLMIEGIKSTVVLQPILGPVAAVIAMQLSYTLGSRSPLHSREAARFMEALYEERGMTQARLKRLAVDTGFDPDETWGSVLIGASKDIPRLKLRAIAWRARVGLETHFGIVRFMEEKGPHNLAGSAEAGKFGALGLGPGLLQRCSGAGCGGNGGQYAQRTSPRPEPCPAACGQTGSAGSAARRSQRHCPRTPECRFSGHVPTSAGALGVRWGHGAA